MLFTDLRFGESLAGTAHLSPIWYCEDRCDPLKALAPASLEVEAGAKPDPRGGLPL